MGGCWSSWNPRGSNLLRRSQVNIVFYSANDLPVGQRRSDGFVNATQLCQAANKRWDNYRKHSGYKPFIETLSKTLNLSELDLVHTERGKFGGTWVHPQVAVHLAMWLSPEFSVLVTQWVVNWMLTAQNPLNTATNSISPEVLGLVEAHLKRTQALNRSIHTAIHQQTDAIREALSTLGSLTQSQTIVVQTVNTNRNKEKLERLLSS